MRWTLMKLADIPARHPTSQPRAQLRPYPQWEQGGSPEELHPADLTVHGFTVLPSSSSGIRVQEIRPPDRHGSFCLN